MRRRKESKLKNRRQKDRRGSERREMRRRKIEDRRIEGEERVNSPSSKVAAVTGVLGGPEPWELTAWT